jgi:hypothetical protein
VNLVPENRDRYLWDSGTSQGRGQRKEHVERREERECGDVVKATNVRNGKESIIHQADEYLS